MKSLAYSLKRIWSARNRVPHQTGWGTFGFPGTGMTIDHMIEAAQTALPTILAIVLNIFR